MHAFFSHFVTPLQAGRLRHTLSCDVLHCCYISCYDCIPMLVHVFTSSAYALSIQQPSTSQAITIPLVRGGVCSVW